MESGVISLPGTTARALYAATDSGAYTYTPANVDMSTAVSTCTIFCANNSFNLTVIQTDPNTPNQVLAGGSLDYDNYAAGPYPPGFGPLVEMFEYNAGTNAVSSGVLPSACIPTSTTMCDIFTNFVAQLPIAGASFTTFQQWRGQPIQLEDQHE